MKPIVPHLSVGSGQLLVGRILPLLFILGTVNAHSQTSTETGSALPDGPLLQPAPNFSQWVIAYTYPEDKALRPSSTPATDAPPATAKVPGRLRTIVTTKTGNIIHESVTDTQQHQRENWYVGATQYRKDADAHVWLENQPETHTDVFYTPLPASGFRELDWISAKNYTGKMEQGGKSCLVFKTTGKVKSMDPMLPRDKDFAMVAYVDVKTRLPVEVDIDKEIRTFTFAEPPQEEQALPADLVKQIKAGQAGRTLMVQPAARPY